MDFRVFIIVTDAWMQHPVAYGLVPNGTFELTNFTALLFNPWAWLQYVHNMCGAVTTAAFVMAARGSSKSPFLRLRAKKGIADHQRSLVEAFARNLEGDVVLPGGRHFIPEERPREAWL